MRIAVCASNTDERHLISRAVDEIGPRKGLIPKISMFPLSQELLEHLARQPDAFDLVLFSNHHDEIPLQQLCSLAPVILIGHQMLGPVAFEVGAAYFVEAPADKQKLEHAISHCLERQHTQSSRRSGFPRSRFPFV